MGDEVYSVLEQLLQEGLGQVAFVTKQLAEEPLDQLGQHLDIVAVARRQAPAEQFTAIIEHQMQLEAEKPAHRSLAARRQPSKDLVLVDTPVITDGEGSGIHETDPGAAAQAGEQIGTQQPQHTWHELYEAPVANQMGKLPTQVYAHMLAVVGFEGAIVALMKVNEEGHDFTRA